MSISYRAGRIPGETLECKSWQQEGVLRMFLNTVDPNVAENPNELVVYGGNGRACRGHYWLDKIVEALKNLENNETLVIQSGKPVAVMQTHPWAPRVLNSCSMLVPYWSNWEYFRELEAKGLTIFGQTTASSWAYIGTQGILQGTFETFSEVASKYFEGSLAGKFVLTAGLGGMSSAQPMAITMNGGVALIVEADPARIQKRLQENLCHISVSSLPEALELVDKARNAGDPLSIALEGNAADIYPRLAEQGVVPDVVTDQTAAHDLLNGYWPYQIPLNDARMLRKTAPRYYLQLARSSVSRHLQAMLHFHERGSVVFDYGNNIREQGHLAGVEKAFSFPGFITAYLRPLLCEGRGPFRWIALSGSAGDIYKLDELIRDRFPDDRRLLLWISSVQKNMFFQGLPARTGWLDREQRSIFGRAINEMVNKGEIGPIAITRDHMDGAAMASPRRETEGMPDGSDAVADWPILNALLNTSLGATMVSIQQGGGVGIGYSVHSGMTVIADGSADAAAKIERVLEAEATFSRIRYADAGIVAPDK